MSVQDDRAGRDQPRDLDQVRAVADAVLYEGYLLYPYRASSSKNQSRWQWGVLGPPDAAASGVGEDAAMSMQCLVRGAPTGRIGLLLRFLQVQRRDVQRIDAADPTRFEPVAELRAEAQTWLSWDEAVSHEVELGPVALHEVTDGRTFLVDVGGGTEVEPLTAAEVGLVGRLVRRREPLSADVLVTAERIRDDLHRLTVVVTNGHDAPTRDKTDAIRHSFIGAHLIVSAEQAQFVSLLDPPGDARDAAAACQQRRCWPVLAGAAGRTDVVLASPIILYDYPEIAEQSAGALFDATEIDEILTLRVLTLTDEEKAAARATDPRAAEIIDRCEQLSPDVMQALHGVLRDPHAHGSLVPPDLDLDRIPTFTDVREVEPASFDTGDAPWWDPARDASVRPESDDVVINGVRVARDSLVRLRPSRRADAQDIFFTNQLARVTAVLSDVDDQVHVAVVLVNDPAADLHEWYGRYMYFAPEELEPIAVADGEARRDREESRP